jgi:hypothetical protein
MIPCVFWKSVEKVDEGLGRVTDQGSDRQCLQRGRILSWPPTSHTVNEMFLYSTVSTLKPVVMCQITTEYIPPISHRLLGW